MRPILNEMSLEGQYSDIDEFVEAGLKPLLKILKMFGQFNFELQKKTDLWQKRATKTQTLHDIIKVRHFSAGQRFKLLLHKITNAPPFWDTDPKQNTDDQYLCDSYDVSGTSIAEACARDEDLLSFWGSKFSSEQIKVKKNQVDEFNLKNFVRAEGLLDWAEIHKHSGLKYREFHDRRFSGRAYGKTYKFNVSVKMRCHGFREGDKFVVLALERDHKLSDSG